MKDLTGGHGGTRSQLSLSSDNSVATPPRGCTRPLRSQHRSGFRVRSIAYAIPSILLEATAGLEPAHKSFADSRVTPSPRGQSEALYHALFLFAREVVNKLAVLFSIIDTEINGG